MIKKVNPKIDFVKLEHSILEFWEKNDIFQKRVASNKGKPKWSFIDGPITANNPMGLLAVIGPSIKDHFGFPLLDATRFWKISFFSQNSRIECSSFTKSILGFTFLIMMTLNRGRKLVF